MKMMFVLPKSKSFTGGTGAKPKHPPLGIAYLSAFLRAHGIECFVYDENVEDSNLFSEIEKIKPDLIGVQALSFNYIFFVELIRRIKSKIGTPIVVGGPHVSATGDEVLRNTPADFAVKGEGELTLLELLNMLGQKTHNFSQIDGLIWRNKDGNIKENRNRDFIENIDDLPFPDFSVFKMERYSYYDEKKLPITTSRGCPYKCNYCSVRLTFSRVFRPKSPKRVADEIEFFYRQGWRIFDVLDDCFNLIRDRSVQICDMIKQRGLKIQLQFYNGIRADLTDKELLIKMKEAGCTFVAFGGESAHNETLQFIGKCLKKEAVENATKLAKEVGIPCSVSFIIGHPGENYKKSLETIKFAASLPCSYVNFFNLVPYPGTELYEWVRKNGRFLLGENEYYKHISSFNQDPIFETDDFTKEERQKAIRMGLLLYRKTVLRYRFGKIFGNMLYLLVVNDFLYERALKFGLWSKIGKKMYDILTSRSRK